MARPKLLFVVMNFSQTGAPRYAFEIDNALDHDKFEVHILSLMSLGANEFDDHYYDHHLKAGSRIHFYRPGALQRVRTSLSYRLKTRTLIDRELIRFLSEFNVVNWIGAYTLNRLPSIVPEPILSRSLVHVLASR